MKNLLKFHLTLFQIYKFIVYVIFIILILFLLMIGSPDGKVIIKTLDYLNFSSALWFYFFVSTILTIIIILKIINYSIKTIKSIIQKESVNKIENLLILIKYLKFKFALDVFSVLINPFIDIQLSSRFSDFKLDQNTFFIDLLLLFFSPNTYGISGLILIFILTLLLDSWNETELVYKEIRGNN